MAATAEFLFLVIVRIFYEDCISSAAVDEEVKWHLATDPIIFGENVTLVCRVPACCEKNEVYQWIGGRHNSLVSYNGGIVHKEKYDIQRSSNEFNLTIKSFDTLDVNRNYTCWYNFKTDTKILTLLHDTYELHPNSRSMNINSSFSANIFTAKLWFKKVHPKPNCTIHLNGVAVRTTQDLITEKVETYFYEANITVSVVVNETLCVMDKDVSCTFGESSVRVYNDTFSSTGCQDEVDKNLTTIKEQGVKNETSIGVILTTVIGVVVLIALIVAVACRRKRKILKKKFCCFNYDADEKNKEEASPMQPNKTESNGSDPLHNNHTTKI